MSNKLCPMIFVRHFVRLKFDSIYQFRIIFKRSLKSFKMMKFCITVLMAISMVGNAALIRLPLDFEVNNYTVIKYTLGY